ncbi:hypothetical protein [Silvimonas soli]|uniref:hypothetical protein n=1 Tax=Silvimonas soli TaxID=2980100 RepID=UPI0024B34A28|nr:hypothetical protein [Silvimonas soli]
MNISLGIKRLLIAFIVLGGLVISSSAFARQVCPDCWGEPGGKTKGPTPVQSATTMSSDNAHTYNWTLKSASPSGAVYSITDTWQSCRYNPGGDPICTPNTSTSDAGTSVQCTTTYPLFDTSTYECYNNSAAPPQTCSSKDGTSAGKKYVPIAGSSVSNGAANITNSGAFNSQLASGLSSNIGGCEAQEVQCDVDATTGGYAAYSGTGDTQAYYSCQMRYTGDDGAGADITYATPASDAKSAPPAKSQDCPVGTSFSTIGSGSDKLSGCVADNPAASPTSCPAGTSFSTVGSGSGAISGCLATPSNTPATSAADCPPGSLFGQMGNLSGCLVSPTTTDSTLTNRVPGTNTNSSLPPGTTACLSNCTSNPKSNSSSPTPTPTTPTPTPCPTGQTCTDTPGDSKVGANAPDKGSFYTPGTDKLNDVFSDFSKNMQQSPILSGASGFFNFSGGGSCPTWTIPSVHMPFGSLPSIYIDQFCGPAAQSMYAIIKVVLLCVATFFAFRWAIL